jgi:cell division protein FtsZ
MALMGIGTASGPDRALEAVRRAIHNPLLEGVDIHDAKGVLLNIAGSSTMTLDEFDQVCKAVTEQVSDDATIIVGMVVDEALGDQLKVTVIASGISADSHLPLPKLRLV